MATRLVPSNALIFHTLVTHRFRIVVTDVQHLCIMSPVNYWPTMISPSAGENTPGKGTVT